MSSTAAYRIGAWSWIVCGAGHTALDLALSLSPASPATEKLHAALREHPFELGGIRRTSLDLFNGISLAMGVSIALAGVLFLLIGRIAGPAGQTRTAAVLGVAVSATLLALAAVLLPLPPIVLFTVASVSFAAALWRLPTRARTTA